MMSLAYALPFRRIRCFTMRGDAKKRPDFLRAPSAIFGKLAEALVFVGGVQVLAVTL